MPTPNPNLWSDFDGTAVRLYPRTDIRRWLKYPLPGVPGYHEFIQAVEQSGVTITGIVSRRPNIFIRRFVTARSLTKLGYDDLFHFPANVILAGSEPAKTKVVLNQSQESVVGMLEDKPHQFVAVLLKLIIANENQTEIEHRLHPISIGAMSSDHNWQRFQRLLKDLSSQPDLSVETETGLSPGLEAYTIIGQKSSNIFRISVYQLPTYSASSGTAFGRLLCELASSNS